MGVFGRVKRGLALTKDSIIVLKNNPGLLAFPLVAGISAVVFFVVFGVATLGIGLATVPDPSALFENEAFLIATLFVIYLVTTFISSFFTAGLVYETRQAFEGKQPEFKRGLAAAWRVRSKLLAWALVSATIGVILRGLESSDSRGARLFSMLFSVAWTVITFFVIPVAVLRPETSIKNMFSESAGTFKQLWGETPIGIVGPNLLAVPLYLVGIVLAFLLVQVNPLVAIAAFAVFAVLGMLLASALRGVIKTSLYVYATEGKRPMEFEGEDIEGLTKV